MISMDAETIREVIRETGIDHEEIALAPVEVGELLGLPYQMPEARLTVIVPLFGMAPMPEEYDA